MATQAQIQANRANAQKSTGPKTGEGKAASSQNSYKHGLYARQFRVHPDDREEYVAVVEQVSAAYPVSDAVGFHFFQQLLHDAWNLHRLRRLENETYATSADPFSEPATLSKLDAIRRHKAHFERSFHRSHKAITAHTEKLEKAYEQDLARTEDPLDYPDYDADPVDEGHSPPAGSSARYDAWRKAQIARIQRRRTALEKQILEREQSEPLPDLPDDL